MYTAISIVTFYTCVPLNAGVAGGGAIAIALLFHSRRILLETIAHCPVALNHSNYTRNIVPSTTCSQAGGAGLVSASQKRRMLGFCVWQSCHLRALIIISINHMENKLLFQIEIPARAQQRIYWFNIDK